MYYAAKRIIICCFKILDIYLNLRFCLNKIFSSKEWRIISTYDFSFKIDHIWTKYHSLMIIFFPSKEDKTILKIIIQISTNEISSFRIYIF